MQQGPLAPVWCAPQGVTKTWPAGARVGMVGTVGCIGRCIAGYHAIFCALPAIRPSLAVPEPTCDLLGSREPMGSAIVGVPLGERCASIVLFLPVSRSRKSPDSPAESGFPEIGRTDVAVSALIFFRSFPGKPLDHRHTAPSQKPIAGLDAVLGSCNLCTDGFNPAQCIEMQAMQARRGWVGEQLQQ